jgi:hypothetical protein
MPKSIVSNQDCKFVSKFWRCFHDALGTKFSLNVVFQSKRTIQTLVDMLYACVLPWNGSWEDHLALVEFAYNNSYPASIKMATYEVLYEGVFLHCVGKYLVSDCWLVHIRYNRLMVRYIRSDRIC